MKIFIYFLQFIIVLSLFMTFKIIGPRNASLWEVVLPKYLVHYLDQKEL